MHGGRSSECLESVDLAGQNGEGAGSPDVIKRRKQANNYVIIERKRKERKLNH